jgi:hypothetical protein
VTGLIPGQIILTVQLYHRLAPFPSHNLITCIIISLYNNRRLSTPCQSSKPKNQSKSTKTKFNQLKSTFIDFHPK